MKELMPTDARAHADGFTPAELKAIGRKPESRIMVEVPWHAWFPTTPFCGDEIFEFAVKLHPYNTVMSLLWLPTRY
jgi:hypothetical protein